ncbi:MAG: SUMF1/EgtB/PvdO family nonheme iron enzyme [Caldilineaceae bacterium]
MDGRTIFSELRHILAALYLAPADAQRIADDAGLDLAQISFDAKAINNWHNILAVAIESAALEPLLARALSEYPQNQPLVTICTVYRDYIAAGGQLPALPLRQSGGPPTLKAGTLPMMTAERKQIEQITATNVALRDQYIVVGGETLRLPQPPELLAYLAKLRARYQRWADQPEPAGPLFDQAPTPEAGPDAYLAVDAKPLPMRLAEFRSHGMGQEAPTQELLTALGDAPYSVILGEPGSGKTTALERLAWVYAQRSLASDLTQATQPRLVLPILARLTDYQGEADLLPLVRRVLNREGLALATDLSVRATLQASDVDFVLLLDGLNEVSRQHAGEVYNALRRHSDEFAKHAVHLTCRTADFDQPQAAAVLPSATQLWEVQPLTDAIRHWGDNQGASDVRDYLRRHLGEERGKRLYERLQADDRLHSLARLPLFLFMFKETAGDGAGDLPANRGDLVRRFVTSDRLLHPVPQELRPRLVRSLECLAWRMAAAGNLEIDEETLYDELEAVRGRRTYELDAMRQHLQSCGLLVALGEERYRLLHQMVQEYGAAAYLAALAECAERLPQLAQAEWWRESCVLTLWLRPALQTPDYLLRVMGDANVDLRVRVAAGEVLAQVGDPRFVCKHYDNGIEAIEPEMVRIPAGEALLGGEDDEAYDWEKPQCQVPVRAFDLAVYPVTNAEFACFIEAGGYNDPGLWRAAGQAWLAGEGKLDAESEAYYRWLHQQLVADTEGFLDYMNVQTTLTEQSKDTYRWLASVSEEENIRTWTRWLSSEGQARQPRLWQDGRFNGPNQPVVGVNWYEASAYAAWLAKVTGRAYRLPSEAEWEWAARRNRRRYPWGNEWDANACNWQGSKLNRTNPVGVFAFSATTDGLHELAGNVYEWTATRYRGYPYRADDGREDPNAEGRRVMRGGSWAVDRTRVRCAYRGWRYAGFWFDNHGFRLARTSL